MTADTTKPNFYLLLGLNPDETWDQTKFERVVRERASEWSRQGSGIGAKALSSRRYIELLPEIRRVMEDPVLRDAEAAAARSELAAIKQSRIEEFEKSLELAQAKGHLELDEMVRLFITFEDVLSSQEIRNCIAVPVHVSNPGDQFPHTSSTFGISKNLIPFRITEEPLTAQNLSTIISALTELSTKYWLIAKGRFSDLIEYTQTHNGRFAEEANVVITRVSYNSPFNMDWKVDLSAPSVAEALITTIDGITHRQERLEKAKLENQAKAVGIKEAEQKAEQENQMALLEQEKRRLELEERRLEVLEKQLEVQKKGIEYALEIAGKVVDTLRPGADPATRAMEIQTLLPNLVQLQNGKGLELAFITSPQSTTDTSNGDDTLGSVL